MFDQDIYKTAFSKVTVSEDVLSKVMGMEREEKRKGFRISYLAVLAALVGILAACAAITFDPVTMLEAAFGENGRAEYGYEEIEYKNPVGRISGRFVEPGERQSLNAEAAAKLLQPYIFEVHESISDGESILTIEACLHDPVTCSGILYMSLENPEGFPDAHVWSNGQVSWLDDNNAAKHYLDTSGWNLFYIVDGEQEETKLDMVCCYAMVEGEEQIQIFYTETGESVTIDIPGETGMEQLAIADGTIILTPMSLAFGREKFSFYQPEEPIIKIRYTDGTEMSVLWHDQYKKKNRYDRTPIKDSVRNYYLMTGYPTDDPSVKTGYLLNFVVDIENVRSVIVNDEEFFVE